jgi:glycosyltransferase involved in cell wall biosynthesis
VGARSIALPDGVVAGSGAQMLSYDACVMRRFRLPDRETETEAGCQAPRPSEAPLALPTPARTDFCYSIVVPVFRSADIVGDTVDRIVEVFEGAGLRYQLILVNDGSRDGSWDVIADKARANPSIVALDLLRNFGQHQANLAGLRESTGDYVITMDDDLQNPPDQALLLIDAAIAGHDVVFGQFERKQSSLYRRLGTKAINVINRRVFGQPPDLVVSNFRILRRDVVDRICASRTAHPYITGQALLYSHRPAHTLVAHHPRRVGKSHYSALRIAALVFTILFSYSVFPLRLAAGLGFVIALGSFAVGCWFLVTGLFGESSVPGWTSVVVLLAMLNGVVIALLSMLGEYVVRTLNTVSEQKSYYVINRVSG